MDSHGREMTLEYQLTPAALAALTALAPHQPTRHSSRIIAMIGDKALLAAFDS